ncbi:hypothetical protein QBC43DRAFT_58314 [Cladorrhinum sp. PSN259]|nr:hypothetical protein QBC43DRAFT_58314 [Cladorrhinum sp. PSN259]
MAESDQNDPFCWDEERLVQEFCTPNRTWKPPAGLKFPEPTAFKAKLVECGIDGNSLLTCTDQFDFKELLENLSIKKLPHQLFLKKVIPVLQTASPGYQRWKLEAAKDKDEVKIGDGEVDDSPPIKSELRGLGVSEPSPSNFGGGPATPMNDRQSSTPAVSSSALLPPVISHGVISPALSNSTLPDHQIIQSVEQQALEQPSAEAESSIGEPPSKKRRVAPVSISAGPVHAVPSFVPTEGDMFISGTTEDVLSRDDSTGFLGSCALFPDRIIQPLFTTFTEEMKSPFAQSNKAIPPGRRLQVWKAMKRYLRADRLAIDIMPEDDGDSVLSLLDSEEDFDEETKREMEKDRQEDEALKERMTSSKKRLTKEEVDEIINSAIQELEARWYAEKKPKLEQEKAWRLWHDARRKPSRGAYLQSLKRRINELNLRLSVILEKFRASDWLRNENLKKQAPVPLEVTVFERLYQKWLIALVQNPRPPAKPSRLPRPSHVRKEERILEDDEEALSSESDDVDGFIDYSDSAGLIINNSIDLDCATGDDLVDHEAMDVDLPDIPAAAPEPKTPVKIKFERPLVISTSQSLHPLEAIELPSSPPVAYERLSEADVPGLDTMEDFQNIEDKGFGYWEWAGDADRLVVAALMSWTRARRLTVFQAVNGKQYNEVWDEYMQPVLDRLTGRQEDTPQTNSTEHRLAQIFDVYTRKSTSRLEAKLTLITWQKLKRFYRWFPAFCDLINKVSSVFSNQAPRSSQPTPQKPRRIVVLSANSTQSASQSTFGGSSQAAGGEADVDAETEVAPESQDPADVNGLSDDDSSDNELGALAKKRRRWKIVNQEAKKMRIATLEQNKEFDRRRQRLQQNLAASIVPSNKTRLIVNETKEDGQALIFINDWIGSRIKDHQIDGVRFMWNQVVVNSSVRQGCLLAHTMGLGKTMQVITLLVVIAESSASEDSSIRDQIPEHLRTSKTLILCPAGLVENWADEIYMWAPENALGHLQVVDSTVSEEQRPRVIKQWASKGGVLIIGYPMFTNVCKNSEELQNLLLETPNLVVGDEAHYMKNPDSQRSRATSGFSTTSRIALTGSPLTNNVTDYYAMISWVAPNYLGPMPEFNSNFAIPIKEGLYADSNASDKRRAHRLLHVLKETVGPKMHRKDADVLHNELPTKKEFIITLPLTDLQERLYREYINCAMDARVSDNITNQARAWSLVAKLGLVLAHPRIFKAVAESKKAEALRQQAKERAGDDVDLPQDLLSQLLEKVAVREIDRTEHSYKILALLRILAECRKVGDKVLVFSHSIPTLDYLESLFRVQKLGYQRLDGSTRIADRQSDTKRFNADENAAVYLISTKAGGIGLNIYGANRVVIFDFKYTPTDEQQAIGRAYRLGQTKPVYVYWLFIGGTFEKIIHDNSVFKAQLASRVVDKKNPAPWSTRYKEYFTPPKVVEQEDLTDAKGQDIVLDALLASEDVGNAIRGITSTETFQKEEMFRLTDEDQREAEQDIKMFQLRTHDPDEYCRQMAARSRIDLTLVPPPVYQPIQATSVTFPSAYQPTPAGGESQTALFCNDNSSPSGRVKLLVPPYLRGPP